MFCREQSRRRLLRMLRAVWLEFAQRARRLDAGAVQLNFVDAPTICELHANYFAEAGPTDVMTFPLVGPGLAGEIYVCYEVARAQAQRHGVPADHELARLALHGLLHLLGFDDRHLGGRRRMRSLEDRFLQEYFSDAKGK